MKRGIQKLKTYLKGKVRFIVHKALILMVLFIWGTKNRLDANLIAGGAGLFWLKNCHEGKKLSYYFASRPTISVSILQIHFK